MTPLVPARASDDAPGQGRVEQWKAALRQMCGALEVLDESEGPAVVGAHLDHSIQKLKDEISAAELSDEM